MNPEATQDERWMALAIAEAKRGRYSANPNPMVGALIVRGEQILGRGFHARTGGAHAERAALDDAAEQGHEVRGATLYVTLEPCSHFGRTPPCSSAIVDAGIQRVVAGTIDPNPRVSGRGFAQLREAGVQVETGVLGDECWRLNEDFMVAIRAGRPMISGKIAVSLDGRIATRSGDSRWITNEESRRRVHELRRDHHAILVGTGTLLHDNPRLTTRLPDEPDARHPARYVLDATLQARVDQDVFDTSLASTTVVCSVDASLQKREELEQRGVRILPVDGHADGLDLTLVFADMRERGFLSVLVEGGGHLLGSLADRGLLDRLHTFIAPFLIGGRDAIAALGGQGIDRIAQARMPVAVTREFFGDDTLIVTDFSPHLHPPEVGD